MAEAVALLLRGRPASKEAWRRLRRRHRGRFPEAIQQGIEEAGQAIVEMIRRREMEARGRCVGEEGTERMGGMASITDDRAFLSEPLWVDPCVDGIRTEPGLDDSRFNPVDKGYRYVVLNRAQFREAIEMSASPPAEVSVADSQPWWPLTAVVAWILTRDPSPVIALSKPLSAVAKGAIFLSLSCRGDKTPRAARRELIDALAVVTKQVVHGEPAERWLSGEGGMRPVHVVDVQPAGQRGGPFL